MFIIWSKRLVSTRTVVSAGGGAAFLGGAALAGCGEGAGFAGSAFGTGLGSGFGAAGAGLFAATGSGLLSGADVSNDLGAPLPCNSSSKASNSSSLISSSLALESLFCEATGADGACCGVLGAF
ncbi:hypothetical protein AN392_03124 [Pseudoalteromonas sp. P1-16-1b]|nr:hypothetical protein AN392_03124 [Pseudoalteromonas sp. P1-16-1b]